MNRRALWDKDWRLLLSHYGIFAFIAIAFFQGLYFLVAYQEYVEIAPALAKLSNRKGASEMLLAPVSDLLIYLLILWSIFFATRLLAQEYEWRTAALWGSAQEGKALASKGLVLLSSMLLLIAPFWIGVGFLSLGTQFDTGILVGIFCAQLLMIAYALGLAFVLSLWLKQAVMAALLCFLFWLGIYLAPILLLSPLSLQMMVRWLSPFSHSHLLQQGIFSLQTGLFVLLQGCLFVSLCICYQQRRRLD